MMSRFGKIAVIMDGASPHRSKMIREHAGKNGMKMIFLPKGSPYLNAVEGCRNQAKREMLASRFYKSRKIMPETLAEYFGAVYFNLSVMKHLKRERNQELEVPDPAKTWDKSIIPTESNARETVIYASAYPGMRAANPECIWVRHEAVFELTGRCLTWMFENMW